jgi:hypothetical protein
MANPGETREKKIAQIIPNTRLQAQVLFLISLLPPFTFPDRQLSPELDSVQSHRSELGSDSLIGLSLGYEPEYSPKC